MLLQETFPGGGTAQAGASYIVSVAGTVDSVAFALNDRIVAITDNASTSVFASNWHKLDYTDEVLSVAGRTGAITLTLSDITDSGSLAALSSVNNANWSGTDLAVTNGGTGSSTASDARTALGVAIGSDVQAFDAGLTSIAGLTTVADRGIYATASDTYATFVLTAAGRALMDDAAASNQRTTLGLGALAVLGTINNGNWSGTDLAVVNGGTGAGDAGTARTNLGLAIGSDVHGFNADFAGLLGPGYTEEYNDIGDRGVATNVTFSTAHVQRIRLTASLTITFNGEPTSGLFGSMILVIDRSGNFTPTLAYGGGAGVTPQGAALNFTNTTNSIDVISVFTVDGGTTFYVAPYIMNAS